MPTTESNIPSREFLLTFPWNDARLEALEKAAGRGPMIVVGDMEVVGLAAVIRLARRGLALEQALRGDPGHDVTAAVVAPTHDRTKAVWNWERMGRALLAITGPFEPGFCRVCGCTRVTACDVPETFPVSYPERPELDSTVEGTRACHWVDESETLCDRPECLAAAGIVNPAPDPRIPAELDGKAGTIRVDMVGLDDGLDPAARVTALSTIAGTVSRVDEVEGLVEVRLGPSADYGCGCDEFPIA